MLTNDYYINDKASITFTATPRNGNFSYPSLSVVQIYIQRKNDSKYWNQSSNAWQAGSIANDMSEFGSATGLYELEAGSNFMGTNAENADGYVLIFYAESSGTPVYDEVKFIHIENGITAKNKIEEGITISAGGTYEYKDILFNQDSGGSRIVVSGTDDVIIKVSNSHASLAIQNQMTAGTLSIIINSFNGIVHINSYGSTADTQVTTYDINGQITYQGTFTNIYMYGGNCHVNSSGATIGSLIENGILNTIEEELLTQQQVRDAMTLTPIDTPQSSSIDSYLGALQTDLGTTSDQVQANIEATLANNDYLQKIMSIDDPLDFDRATQSLEALSSSLAKEFTVSGVGSTATTIKNNLDTAIDMIDAYGAVTNGINDKVDIIDGNVDGIVAAIPESVADQEYLETVKADTVKLKQKIGITN